MAPFLSPSYAARCLLPRRSMVVGDRPRAAAVCGGGIDRTTEPRGSWSVARIAAAWIFLLHVVTPACWVWGVASTPCPHEDVVSRPRRISVLRRLKASLGPACRPRPRRSAVRRSHRPRRGRRSLMRLRTPRRTCTRPSLRRRPRRICRGRHRTLRRRLPPTTWRRRRRMRIRPPTRRSPRA